jgi:uncharacterized protein
MTITPSVSRKFPSPFQQRYGEWAVVTGASSGIGREIALELAARGLNLVLVARSHGEIEKLARFITSTYQVEAEPVRLDLSIPEARQALVDSVGARNVGLLVNAAGFGTGGAFLEANAAEQSSMVEVNCTALLELTYAFARRFAVQSRGGIILLSSIVAFQGVARSANYAATKAYVQSLAEALAVELKPHGIDVLCAAPGPTQSGFAERAGMTFSSAESAQVVAREIVAALGRKRQVLPGRLSKLLYAALMTAPRFLRVQIMKQVMASMTPARRS